MKKFLLLGTLFFIVFTSFEIHKFYSAIYQVNYDSEKKMIQITTRIFTDDLNQVLEKKYNQKIYLGEKNESPQAISLMNKYITENFSFKVNKQQKPLLFLSREFESNVIICYYKISNISKINKLEVQNSILIDLFPEQQNIIQSKIYNKKTSLLFTDKTIDGVLK